MGEQDKRIEMLGRVRRMAERHAARNGFALQPDRAQLDYVLGGMAENWTAYGRPYCPCRPVTGDEEKDRLNICPCRSHREDIAKFGECECSLFVRDGHNPGKE
jgi:ferredoxin-thioredoxin reductase catalytic subunit